MSTEAFGFDNLSELVRSVRSTSNFWLFHHLPKTAGSSMSPEMEELLPPYRNIHVDPDDREGTQVERLSRSTASFLNTHAASPFQSASGHLRQPQVDAILAAIPNTRMFTILRDPVARVISGYLYMGTAAHPGREEHLRRYPSLEAYVEDDRTNDRMPLFFLQRKRPSARELLERIESLYTFVGFVEDWELSFQFLTLLMFSPVRPRPRRLNEALRPAASTVSPSPELRAKIEAANSVEVQVYRSLHQKHDLRRDEMRSLICAGRRS